LSVVVLERGDAPGAGSSSRATGGYRAQFGSEINVRLSLLSREKLRRFEEETGVDSGYDPRGYLFLATHCDELSALASANNMQRRLGLTEAEVITTSEAARIVPEIEATGIVGATFCPTDGFIRPTEILRGYFEAAQRAGAIFQFKTGVLSAVKNGGRIESVRSNDATWTAPLVINAAGAWASEFAALCGATLPVTPLKRHVVPTSPTAVIGPTRPMTIWVSDGFHFRYRDGRLLLLRSHEPAMQARYDTSMESAWIDETVRIAHERVPALRGVQVDRDAAWSGLYEMSPDRHAIVGRSPEVDNLFFANGSSGHGVMHAPAIGQLLAELIVDGKTSIDISPLRPSRFAENDPVVGSALL
jgi:sarcosine oxidase, subunit beta